MADYEKMNAILCGAVDDAISALEPYPWARTTMQALQNAMMRAESVYIETTPYTSDDSERKIIPLVLEDLPDTDA